MSYPLLFLPFLTNIQFVTQFVSFQVNLATDGESTYVSYIYEDQGMLWQQGWLPARVGYNFGHVSSETRLNQLNSPKAYRYDAVVGNTGSKGLWLWKLSDKVQNEDAKCYAWHAAQPSIQQIDAMRSAPQNDCPCTLSQIRLDSRYRYEGYTPGITCFKTRATRFFFFTSTSFHTQCCYRWRFGTLINHYDPDIWPTSTVYLTQKFSWENIRWSWYLRQRSRTTSEADDGDAFSSCCKHSPLCWLFESKRPIPNCSRYRPPLIGMA